MRKDTDFFGYMQIFLYFCSKFCNKMTLEEYISLHTSPENEVLEAITRDTHVHILNPHMLSGHVQGRVLSMLSHMIRPKRILELGTFTGYSALCLAEGLAEGGRLITIEHNDELEETIQRNIAKSPLSNRIELIIGDAVERVNELRNEGVNELRNEGMKELMSELILTPEEAIAEASKVMTIRQGDLIYIQAKQAPRIVHKEEIIRVEIDGEEKLYCKIK